MFSGLMMNTWITASIVAVIAGVTGFFAVLRGQSFAAHAIPNGAFAGAAGAGLLGLNVIWGPGYAIAVATAIALVTVWAGIVLSYRTNWPLGFYVGVIAAGFFLLGQGWAAVRPRGSAPRPVPALGAVQ